MIECDVLVIGAGPAGFGATMGAALAGASVTMVERHPMLGGMGTVAMVNNFCKAHHDGERLIIGGVFGDLRRRLIDLRAIFPNVNMMPFMEPFDPIIYAEVMREQCLAAGARIFLSTKVSRLTFADDRPVVCVLDNAQEIHAKTVVDATGDASVAASGGIPFSMGRSADGAVMPLTFCYMLGPVDLESAFTHHPEVRQIDANTGEPFLWLTGFGHEIKLARAKQELSIERDHIACAMSVPGRKDYVTVNFGRVFVNDPTDPKQLAEAERVGRMQVDEGVKFFRKYIAGFENAELVEVARQIGVRQSRQIEGLYTLTLADVLEGRQFEDVVAQCHYPVDIHEPDSDKTTFRELPKGIHYDIPLRCLIPSSGPGNLIVAGRSISATAEAMSSFRVSPTMIAIGEAAGTTAALACQHGQRMADVPYSEIREHLVARGGILN